MGERQTISHVSFLSLVCQSMVLQSPQDQGHTLWLDIQAFQYVLSLVIPSTTSHLFQPVRLVSSLCPEHTLHLPSYRLLDGLLLLPRVPSPFQLHPTPRLTFSSSRRPSLTIPLCVLELMTCSRRAAGLYLGVRT